MKFLQKTILLVIVFFISINSIYAEGFIDLYSKNAILYDLNDNTLLYELNSKERIPIASLTKIMTSIVALENIDDVNSKVTLTWKAFEGLIESDASVAGFQVGEQVTYLDLLYGALLPSGAEATQALAIYTSGSIEEHIKLMNDKAESLGLKNSKFSSVTGLIEINQYSSVEDIATLLKYSLKNEIFKEVFTHKSYTASNGLAMYSTLLFYGNQYNVSTKYIKGAKTGYTEAAGLCMASISNLNDMNLLLVTAGASSLDNRIFQIKDAVNVYEHYKNNYKEMVIVEKDQLLVSIKTKFDKREYIDFYAQEELVKLLPKETELEDIEIEYDGEVLLTTKSEVGSKLGIVNIIYEDEVIDSIDIILNEKVNFNLFRYIKENWIICIIIALVLIIAWFKFKQYKRRKKLKYRYKL